MKSFFKKLKDHFFLKTTISEMVILVLVVALIIYKFKSDSEASRKIPVGDFGPSPYVKYLNAQEEK